MKVFKLQDEETLNSLEGYENDKGRFYMQIFYGQDFPAFITLDKEDCEYLIKELNDYING